jgi:hypothetical protein
LVNAGCTIGLVVKSGELTGTVLALDIITGKGVKWFTVIYCPLENLL